MFLYRLNSHFLPMEDACSQGSLGLGVLKDLREMLHFTGSTGGNHGNGDIIPDVIDQLDIKAGIGAVFINAVQENLSGTELLAGLCQLQGINISAFSTAFHGALIPAVLFSIGAGEFGLDGIMGCILR
jgi:hypothetical protein